MGDAFPTPKVHVDCQSRGVEEEDEPLVRVVVDADVQELVLHEADGGEPGRLVAGEDGHHLCSLSLTSNNWIKLTPLLVFFI